MTSTTLLPRTSPTWTSSLPPKRRLRNRCWSPTVPRRLLLYTLTREPQQAAQVRRVWARGVGCQEVPAELRSGVPVSALDERVDPKNGRLVGEDGSRKRA